MKIKTSELTGNRLIWAVAKCETPEGGYKQWVQDDLDKGITHGMEYPTDWLWGGPIIERERIELVWRGDNWVANPSFEYETGVQWANGEDGSYTGPTPLIAAMRCYVASKLGKEVEVPDELN